ncbi:MAG: beta-galactosidase trimerization domain-containing protein [Armatimonadota bacterium]
MSERSERIANTYRRFYTSQHYEDWDPRIFARYDIADFLRRVEALDADVIYCSARTHNGLWFADVGAGGMHRGLKGVDQLRAFLDHFHARGKLVAAYFSTVYDKQLYDEHPEWRQVDPDGRPVAAHEGSWGKILCLNSPYRDHLIAMLTRLVETHDIDGFFLDMTFFHANPCYCESCTSLFRAKHGAAPPTKEDWDDPLYRAFVQFRLDTNQLFVRDICQAIKRANPDLFLGVQHQVLRGGAISGQTVGLGREADYLYSDIYFGGGYLHMSVCTRLAAAISRLRPEIGIMTRPGSHADAPHMKSLDHLRSEAFTALANGGAVMFFDIMLPDGTVQAPMWERIGRVLEEMRACEPWLGGTPLKSVAVLYSERSRIWYGRGDRRRRYDDHFFGACRALIEDHLPYDIIVDVTKETLAGYQVLLLPNAACLSAEEVEAIREFVRGGGGLVCTGETSRCSEAGEAGDYQLGDVLGISHVADTGLYSKVYSRFDLESPVARRLPSDGYIAGRGPLAQVKLKGAEALARIVFPIAEPTADRFVNIMTNPPAVPSDWPACTRHRFGKGRAIYFAGGLDRDYVEWSFPELRWVLCDAIRHAAGAPLKLELQAPASVELGAFERENGRQLVVHLVNFQPEVGRELDHSRHLIGEAIPVHDLELTVRADRPVRAARLQPANTPLTFEQEGEEAKVHILRLDCHAMVVLDLG